MKKGFYLDAGSIVYVQKSNGDHIWIKRIPLIPDNPTVDGLLELIQGRKATKYDVFEWDTTEMVYIPQDLLLCVLRVKRAVEFSLYEQGMYHTQTNHRTLHVTRAVKAVLGETPMPIAPKAKEDIAAAIKNMAAQNRESGPCGLLCPNYVTRQQFEGILRNVDDRQDIERLAGVSDLFFQDAHHPARDGYVATHQVTWKN